MRYKVNTKFVFEGYFEIEADNRNEAKRLVGENCGLVMGGNIHTDGFLAAGANLYGYA
jgi:hypothetical protein